MPVRGCVVVGRRPELDGYPGSVDWSLSPERRFIPAVPPSCRTGFSRTLEAGSSSYWTKGIVWRQEGPTLSARLFFLEEELWQLVSSRAVGTESTGGGGGSRGGWVLVEMFFDLGRGQVSSAWNGGEHYYSASRRRGKERKRTVACWESRAPTVWVCGAD